METISKVGLGCGRKMKGIRRQANRKVPTDFQKFLFPDAEKAILISRFTSFSHKLCLLLFVVIGHPQMKKSLEISQINGTWGLRYIASLENMVPSV